MLAQAAVQNRACGGTKVEATDAATSRDGLADIQRCLWIIVGDGFVKLIVADVVDGVDACANERLIRRKRSGRARNKMADDALS